VADARGLTVALSHLPMLVALDLAGDSLHERWRRTLREPIAVGPVIIGDGTRVALTVGGEVLGFSPGGTLVFQSETEPVLTVTRSSPIALEGGGAVFGVGPRLLFVDPEGHVREWTRLADRSVQALISSRIGFLAIDDTGDVIRAGAVFMSRAFGGFGGDVGAGPASADENTLVAVVDHRRVVDLDLSTFAAHDRFVAPSASLEGRIVLGRDGDAYVTTFTGTLLAIDRTGAERFRSVLEPGGAMTGANGALNPEAIAPAAPLIVDAGGRTAFARPGGRTGVVGPDGAVVWVQGATCPSPVALCPTGVERFVVACRDGTILLIGGS
jgi:outer membrane protein assembly factor BamB